LHRGLAIRSNRSHNLGKHEWITLCNGTYPSNETRSRPCRQAEAVRAWAREIAKGEDVTLTVLLEEEKAWLKRLVGTRFELKAVVSKRRGGQVLGAQTWRKDVLSDEVLSWFQTGAKTTIRCY